MLFGTFVTTVGNAMHTLSVGKVLYDRTGSAAAFGAVIVFEQLVSFLLQFVAGPWVDRGDPRRTCVAVELFRGTVVAASALVLATSPTVIGWIFVMSVAIRVAQPFYRAATFSLGPGVVPPSALGRYNAYSNLALQGGQLTGLALAGPILTFGGPPAAFFVNGLTFFLSALAVATVRMARSSQPTLGEAWWRQLFGGWSEIARQLRSDAGLAWHLVLCTVDQVAVSLFNLTLVPVALAAFGSSAYGLTVVDGAYTVGAMASVPLVDRLVGRIGTRGAALVGIAGQAAGFALLGSNLHPYLSLVWAFGIGASNTVSWTVLTTALQLRIDRRVKGRISTVRSLMITSMGALLIPVVSWMGEVSTPAMLAACAAICATYAAAAAVLGRPHALGARLLGAPPEQRSVP